VLTAPSNISAWPAPSSHHCRPREVSFHSKMSAAGRGASEPSSLPTGAALTASQAKARDIFASLEAEIMQRDLDDDDSNHSG